MIHLVSHPPPGAGASEEIRIFAKTRNEFARIPHFLDYHRRLGVTRFIIVDNDSSDGTVLFLRAQPDVHLYVAPGSFKASAGGQVWINILLSRHGTGHWCLTLDADELIFYPGIETTSLPQLCSSLSLEGSEALACMLLDMYGAGPPGKTLYQAGQPFLDACSWFDPGPYWRAGPGSECPYYEIYGGVRQRVFYPRWESPTLGLRLQERAYNAGNRVSMVRRSRFLQSWRTERPPNLAKVPLVRWRDGLRYLATAHKISPVRLSGGTGTLLHFKFLDDFASKADREAKRGEYFSGAQEYVRYARTLQTEPDLSLWHPRSVRLSGSRQLCDARLMTPLPSRHSGGRSSHAKTSFDVG